MNLFCDTVRKTKPGWLQATTKSTIIFCLESEMVDHISIDHILAKDERGADILKWIRDRKKSNPNYPVPMITVHTANLKARKEMESILEEIAALPSSTGGATV